MLNRTNQTLSALAHSTRRNVGTRSLAANASVNHGDQTFDVRHSLHGLMRDGMDWIYVVTVPQWGPHIQPIPGSFSFVQQCPSSCVTRQRSFIAAAVRVESEPRPADLVGRPEPCVLDRGLGTRTTPSTTWSTALDTTGLRLLLSAKTSAKHGIKRTARRAAKPVARRSATSGK
jgi:hypothetical protein